MRATSNPSTSDDGEDVANRGTTSSENPMSERVKPNATDEDIYDSSGTTTSRIKSMGTFRFEEENDYEEEI